MSIKENKAIKVYNENDFVVCVHSHIRDYTFEPASNGIPTMIPMSYAEIEYINSNSPVFRIGLLTFDGHEKEELYESLSIFDWENILTNEKIEEIILNPSVEGIKTLVNIRETALFEKVRGTLTWMKNSGQYDISNRVVDVINRRYEELSRGQLKTDIIVKTVENKPKNNISEVDDLKRQLQEMQNQMAKLLEQMQSANAVESTEKAQPTETAQPANTPKKRGRPKGSVNK